MSTPNNFEINLAAGESLELLRHHSAQEGVELAPHEEVSIVGLLGQQKPVNPRDEMLRGDIVFAKPGEPPTREFVLHGLFRAVQAQIEAPKRARAYAESTQALQSLEYTI